MFPRRWSRPRPTVERRSANGSFLEVSFLGEFLVLFLGKFTRNGTGRKQCTVKDYPIKTATLETSPNLMKNEGSLLGPFGDHFGTTFPSGFGRVFRLRTIV